MNYENEIWEPIKDYEGLYEVSDMGRVKSLKRRVKAGMSSSRWLSEKILSVTGGKIKYKVVNLCKKGNIKSRAIHKLVAQTFLSHTPNGLNEVVDHINGNKHDNRLENLQLVTQRENLAKAHGLICPNCGYKH